MELRYGLNPGSTATIAPTGDRLPFRVVHGHPSYINVLDALNGWRLVRTIRAHTGKPAAASFKHVSPAGAAVAGAVDEVTAETWRLGPEPSPVLSAYARARDADPRSSYGDFIAVSDPVDDELAEMIASVLSDGIIAPGYATGAVDRLARKKGGEYLILEADPRLGMVGTALREYEGVRLRESRAEPEVDAAIAALPSLPQPTQIDAVVALGTVRYTQSNAIALAVNGMAVGIGAGQQSRVDCTRIAGRKASVWWLRRHPVVCQLPFKDSIRRQERLALTIRLIEGDLTRSEEQLLTDALTEPVQLAEAEKQAWLAGIPSSTLASDGLITFEDNIDHAVHYGVTTIIEPGGSSRSGTITAECARRGIGHIQTGHRLFHH